MGTVLVTGGAGFIGSHLCLKLLQQNDVICVDSLISGNKQNLSAVFDEPGFTYIEHDITIPFDVGQNLDEVYNLACPASPPDYQAHPVETLMVCAAGVKNVLDLAVKHKARFLHTSTSEVYGDPLEHPQKETYWGHVNPIGTRSCYDEGKRFAESLIVNYRQKYDLDAKIVRIFNTYGPMMRANDGRVVSNFINQALQGEDLTIYGDGTQTRSFCYVADMINGILAITASGETGPVNLGNPVEMTVGELADKILDLTGSSSRTVNKPLPADDPTQRRPDITLAQERLAWNPSVSLDDGLKETIKWFRKQ
ncbi:MAG: UDP-glucuronic acid decarboxylase family protein [Actinomycetota bacterium]